ncbi:hypothetical protein SARC_02821 [Sphaeroforma arctica JP610]|uniref:Uncharacterized protein n=1 Tax=Sphaeroforma arctica JP610 TaxID=667725 RepID=A0A0L0G7U4_9EUKA|nr:hypothetical protein SARC_02821 [Sphaeroforma arctica JP610]KNC84966.1 hypothetical protein SARC_02821 [Sphaeroforma arctica JP610]|eukprot:XP_014158868.1 hypothetical protein SARC_02821 [Sphaeroforma arctica JP610]
MNSKAFQKKLTRRYELIDWDDRSTIRYGTEISNRSLELPNIPTSFKASQLQEGMQQATEPHRKVNTSHGNAAKGDHNKSASRYQRQPEQACMVVKEVVLMRMEHGTAQQGGQAQAVAQASQHRGEYPYKLQQCV